MRSSNGRYLNVAAEMPRSVANGPGIRYVVWLQGCPLLCPGCFNPDFQPIRVNRLTRVEALAERVLTTSGIEGVTYTGGEPIIQDAPLYELSAILKSHGLGIVCYSGFTIEELRKRSSPFTAGLLGVIDMLIDGRFEQGLKANLLWRGSPNQKIHFLTDRYARYKPLIEGNLSQMEIEVCTEGMVMTGTLQERLIARLEEALVCGTGK